jgi:isoleucyl-tRNA synthetase
METAQDKADAFQTLYHCLVEFSKVLAPVLPFLSEAIYQHLVVEMGVAKDGEDSVHLCDFPVVQSQYIDARLESQISLTREVVSLGRALREKHKLKTRQPLQAVTIVHHDAQVRADLQAQAHLLTQELNVKNVRLEASDAELTNVSFQANFKRLGRRCGKQMRDVANAIADLSRDQWNTLHGGETINILGFDIEAEDVQIRREARGDVVIETQGAMLVALDTELTPALLQEGIVRECIRSIQQFRKDSGLEISDRIHLKLTTTDSNVQEAINAFGDKIAEEVLASQIEVASVEADGEVVDINGASLGLRLL